MACFRMRVYLYASHGSSPDAFAALMGAASDRPGASGDWCHDSRQGDSRDVEPHVLWLIDRFRPGIERARTDAPGAQFQVTVCVEMAGNLAPAASLSRETIGQLAALGLSIDVDLHAFDDADALAPLPDYRCVIAAAPAD